MSKTGNWTRVDVADEYLVYKDGNRRITKSNFGTDITATLIAAGFQHSTNAIAELKITNISANYTVLNTDVLILVDCSGGTRTLTMPTAASMYDSSTAKTQVIWIKRIDAHATNFCRVLPNGSEQIDLAAQKDLTTINLPVAAFASNGTGIFTIG